MFHVLPPTADEVSVTLPPVQNCKGPPADIVGTGGFGLTVTVVGDDTAAQPEPLVALTVNVPVAVTPIDGVCKPLLHV